MHAAVNLNAVAIAAGKKYVRPETDFLHYTYHASPTEVHVTIPFYENFCWALANFQLKTQEGVNEGKRLLDKLLPFQNKDGEFPVYLHEYPEAKDHFLGIYLFQPLYYIKKDFSNVMGAELKVRLNEALTKMYDALKTRYAEKQPQGHIRFKYGALLWAVNQDDSILRENTFDFVTSTHLADLEFARDLGAPHLPSWPALNWHPELQVFCGQAYKELHEGSEPEVTLLDLMMGAERKKSLSPHHVALSLVQSCPLPTECQVEGVKHGKTWGYAALGQEGEAPLYHQPGFHLFRFLTAGENGLDSFSIPGGKFKKVSFKETDKGIKFRFDLTTEFETENREKSREIELFTSIGTFINCSSFREKQPVELDFKHVKLTCTFNKVLGEGDFFGHRSRGNRPSQIVKGTAYDEVLSLRTLRRSSDSAIELTIEIHEKPL